jgi:MscS family membrane protein
MVLHWWSTLRGIPFFKEPLFIKLLVVLATVIILHAVVRFLLYRLMRVATISHSYWDDVLTYGAMKPLPAAIWLWGVSHMAKMIARTYQFDDWLEGIVQARNILALILVGWFFWRMIDEIRQQFLVRTTRTDSQADQTTVDALCKLGYLTVTIITLITLLQTLGVSISGLLAAGGIGGIAIGFAAKDILANFFGGLTIYLDRPFSVGDWIRSPDKDIEGTVEMISWRHTRIRRFNKNPIYVPNMLFTTIAVENPSRMSHRRIREVIGIRYSDLDKMAVIVNDVRHMLRTHPDIEQTQTLIVNFLTFNASSLDFMIYTFTKTRVWVDYHHIKQDVLLKVADIIRQHGAKIALPTQTIHLSQDSVEPADASTVPER